MRKKKPKINIDWSLYPQGETETDSQYTDRIVQIVKEEKKRLRGGRRRKPVDISLPIFAVVNVEGYPFYCRTNSDPKWIRGCMETHGLKSKPWRDGKGPDFNNTEFFTGNTRYKYGPSTVEKLRTWNPFPLQGGSP